MILIPILLAFLTGLMILRLFDQYNYINIFEQLALGFCIALSLFVFELFIGGIIFNKLSLIGPIITFFVCLSLFIYKIIKNKHYRKDISFAIRNNCEDVKKQFMSLKSWKKYLIIALGIYVIIKIFMVFSINTHMPTFDEDSVAGRDLKTKVFTENKSLILDKTSPEFLGSALERNVFAPLTDTYFLLSQKGELDGLTNIISPLLYFLSILLLFGILLRKTNIFFAIISGYIFASMPFIFVHGFGSYRNFISGVLLFLFVFYMLDQILSLENVTNKKIVIPLSILAFLATTIRNESFILITSIIVFCGISYYFIQKKQLTDIKYFFKFLLLPILGVLIGRLSGKYITSLYPSGSSLNVGGIGTKQGLLESLLTNINQPGILKAPFQQAFNHPDYNIIFLLLIIIMILYIISKLSYKKIILYVLSFLILLGGTTTILLANLDMGLITHFGFVRFSVVYIIFMVYLLSYMSYELIQKFYNKN